MGTIVSLHEREGMDTWFLHTGHTDRIDSPPYMQAALSTPLTFMAPDSSAGLNRVGKSLHILTHRRQPWQTSNTRSRSRSGESLFRKSLLCHGMGYRMGLQDSLQWFRAI